MIFPEDRFRSPEEMVWANLSMHLVLPVVVLLAVWYRRSPLTPLSWRQIGWVLAFPVAYGLFVLVTHVGFGVRIPYAFLDPGRDGRGVTIATCTLTVMVFIVVASAERILLALRRSVIGSATRLAWVIRFRISPIPTPTAVASSTPSAGRQWRPRPVASTRSW